MRLRYRYRLYPAPGRCIALARTFGCARVVFNDFVAARDQAHRAGGKPPSGGALQRKLITEAKKTPERAWLSEASDIVLQQAVRPHSGGFRIRDNERLTLRIGDVRVAWSRDRPSAPTLALHRDHDAAHDILAAGRAESQNACGDRVRPPSGAARVTEAGTHRSAR